MGLILESINKIINFITTSSFSLNNIKPFGYMIILLLIKKFYGYTIIFDILIILFSVNLFILVGIDISLDIDPTTSITSRNSVIAIIYTYLIANTPYISNTTSSFINNITMKSKYATTNPAPTIAPVKILFL